MPYNLRRLAQAMKNLTMETIRANLKKPGGCEETRLFLPKFTIESTLDLVKPLRKVW